MRGTYAGNSLFEGWFDDTIFKNVARLSKAARVLGESAPAYYFQECSSPQHACIFRYSITYGTRGSPYLCNLKEFVQSGYQKLDGRGDRI